MNKAQVKNEIKRIAKLLQESPPKFADMKIADLKDCLIGLCKKAKEDHEIPKKTLEYCDLAESITEESEPIPVSETDTSIVLLVDLKKTCKALNEADLLEDELDLNKEPEFLLEEFCKSIEAINDAGTIESVPKIVIDFYEALPEGNEITIDSTPAKERAKEEPAKSKAAEKKETKKSEKEAKRKARVEKAEENKKEKKESGGGRRKDVLNMEKPPGFFLVQKTICDAWPDRIEVDELMEISGMSESSVKNWLKKETELILSYLESEGKLK